MGIGFVALVVLSFIKKLITSQLYVSTYWCQKKHWTVKNYKKKENLSRLLSISWINNSINGKPRKHCWPCSFHTLNSKFFLPKYVLTSVIFSGFNNDISPSCHFSSFLKRAIIMGTLRIKVPRCILQHVVCSRFKETEEFASVSKRARYWFLVFECDWLYSNFQWPQDDKSLENTSPFRCPIISPIPRKPCFLSVC